MSTTVKPHRIAILAGGPSAEREVSIQTGSAIQTALCTLGYDVITIDPDQTLSEALQRVQPDLIFNALHGTYGEDGVIQGYLDWIKLPYTGSGVKSSAVAMDKAMSRVLFKSANIPVAEGCVWSLGEPYPLLDQLPQIPWIIKPTNEGSSVGLDRCDSYEALISILTSKSNSGPTDWLIESFHEGTEVSVVVFDEEVWGCVEISPSGDLYDYEAKYVRGDTTYHCPPRVKQSCIKRLEAYALKAYKVLECSGICRVDFITYGHQDIILELNTLPGMTSTSLVPKVAAWRGISFESLVELIIASAYKDK
jgi:D-alanine-D-alanine ligase